MWSTYTKTVDEACDAVDKVCENKTIVKDEVSLVSYIDQLWRYLKDSWLNVVDIIQKPVYCIRFATDIDSKRFEAISF